MKRTEQSKKGKCKKLTNQLEHHFERVKEIDGLFASAPVEIINIEKRRKTCGSKARILQTSTSNQPRPKSKRKMFWHKLNPKEDFWMILT